jgi:hypothetical protein
MGAKMGAKIFFLKHQPADTDTEKYRQKRPKFLATAAISSASWVVFSIFTLALQETAM